jgi:two-component system OmpR family response regulator
MHKVLLIDDDTELVGMIQDYLQQEGFTVDCALDGNTGTRLALSGDYAMVVLDVMMPQLNGIGALRAIRARSQVPILMLTGRGDDMDRILGLELGADDYVTKPCTPRELSARVRAILRRTQASAQGDAADAVLTVGDLTIMPQQRRVTWDGRPVDVTSTEFNLLEVLARNAGRAVSKNELSEKGLGRPLTRFDRNIDVHLSSLRQKLGTLADGKSCILTVFRQGYQLVRG